MNSEMLKYLEDVGLTESPIAKAKEIYKFYDMLFPGQITDIFVTDYINAGGERTYENLWFFTNVKAMEAKGFLTRTDYDCTTIKDKVLFWELTSQQYDFANANNDSRMRVVTHVIGGLVMEMKASRKNCDNLFEILKKYIVPNCVS